MKNTLDNQQTIKNIKNTTLLFFEALACIMIVFIHCQFPGDFGIIMNGFARFGVPLFFVVSGFFMIKPDMSVEELRRKLRARAIRVAFLLLFSFVIYFVFDAITSCLWTSKTPFTTWLADMFSWEKIVLLFICNNPLTNTINWFMIAMLFSYLIIYIFPKLFISNKIIPIILSSLLVFWIVFRIIVKATGASLFGIELSNEIIYRSWYANGLLFISLGIVLKRHEDLMKRIPFYLVVSLLIFFMIAAPFEHFIIVKCLDSGISYYFCNIISVVTIIALCVQKPDLFFKSKLLNQEGNWMMYVYIFHPAIINILGSILNTIRLSSNVVIAWVEPIFVALLAVGVSVLFNYVFVKIKHSLTKKHQIINQQ